MKKVLIVEDEGITSFELETKIENWGYSVVGTAISGVQAYKMVEEFKPDLIIMDIQLTGVEDGVEVIENIQSKNEIPFIYVTAYSSNVLMDRAHKTLPYAYITKPFNDRELKFAIELALYKYEMEQKMKESESDDNKLMDNLLTGIFTADLNGNILFTNKYLDEIILSNVPSKDSLETDRLLTLQDHLKTEAFLDNLKKNGEINYQILKIMEGTEEEMKVSLSAKLKDNMIYGIVY